jgi:hypothetical protein
VYATTVGAMQGFGDREGAIRAEAQKNGERVRHCFMKEGFADAWTLGMTLTLRPGVNGVGQTEGRHEGEVDRSIVVERLKDCVLNDAVFWRFSPAPAADGGLPTIRVTVGMVWTKG